MDFSAFIYHITPSVLLISATTSCGRFSSSSYLLLKLVNGRDGFFYIEFACSVIRRLVSDEDNLDAFASTEEPVCFSR